MRLLWRVCCVRNTHDFLNMKQFIRSHLPESFIALYHLLLAVLANLWYRFPSRRLTVIGVTGTNGKTTVCNLIAHILSATGYKTGLTTTINFKIGDRVWSNRTKQGMQGRFGLQRLLREMVSEGCTHAVVETTSEGIKQYRHFGIRYSVAVFTNLTPEHIESHGSFEKYREAKGKLFSTLNERGGSVVNGDDSAAEYFLKFKAGEKWVYKTQNSKLKTQNYGSELKILQIREYHLSEQGSEFEAEFDGKKYVFTTKLLGLFNVYNSAAAISAALSLGVQMEVIQGAVSSFEPLPGRMEIIRNSIRNITIVVDYAHDPAALSAVYKTIRELHGNGEKPVLVAVLGACGGGRDKAKRPILGKLASQHAKYVIFTNEDPYDDDPEEIMDQLEEGMKTDPSRAINRNYWKILDRREAIKKAIALSCDGGTIALTGKGCEEAMAVKDGLIMWDDRKVAREELLKLRATNFTSSSPEAPALAPQLAGVWKIV